MPSASPTMESQSQNASLAITLEPCQVCGKLKEKFYLCDNGHTTCDECKRVRMNDVSASAMTTAKTTPTKKQVSFSSPLTSCLTPGNAKCSPPPSNQGADGPRHDSMASPLSPPLAPSTSTGTGGGLTSRLRSASSHKPPSIFAFSSPIKSLVSVPKAASKSRTTLEPASPPLDSIGLSKKRSAAKGGPAAGKNRGLPADCLEIFCNACNLFVEAHFVRLPPYVVRSFVRLRDVESIDAIDAVEPVNVENADSSDVEETTVHNESIVPTTSSEQSTHDVGLKDDVDFLRLGLVNAVNELLVTREHLDEVMVTTDKLEMDVDMLRGGLNFVFFDFDSVLKRKEVRLEETICGIPLLLMVRLRLVSRVPHLGFFVGLDKHLGRQHSPLKKLLVFRAHNACGKVIEKHSLKTFENGQCVHPCFDLTKRPVDGSLWGYADFLKKDRILKPDVLKNGFLCLSLQIRSLPEA